LHFVDDARRTPTRDMRARVAPAGERRAVFPDPLRSPEPQNADVAPHAAPIAAPTPDRLTQLTSAGFARDRALEILRKESQLREAAIAREYVAAGAIQPLNGGSPAAIGQQLRKEMGDDEYERYLHALGKATRVRVGAVEADSAAANAGILSGDEILAYAGKRVFSLRDLNALMLQTSEGETVATTVVRGGQTIQLYAVGGALGISQWAARSP
jgi:predicted metalloprotease with PDZ domain